MTEPEQVSAAKGVKLWLGSRAHRSVMLSDGTRVEVNRSPVVGVVFVYESREAALDAGETRPELLVTMEAR